LTKILIINGWTKQGDEQHIQASCILQKNIFESLIKNYLPNSQVNTCDTYDENEIINVDNYDAFMWTGGGGNIYEKNSHNYLQLKLCEKIMEKKKPIWGSCWGMQVIITALGGSVKKSQKPEFGYSKNINITSSTLNNSIYKDKNNIFDAPAHHYDIVNQLPTEFEIISENEICIQSIYSTSSNIFCTQYHSELPYDYIASLMLFWKENYKNFFSETKFNEILRYLEIKEKEDKGQRLKEIDNWLSFLTNSL
tara:strand:- start:391 stop:1146 length:756 start_codon:yes stop_codon:yes gene_type:complete